MDLRLFSDTSVRASLVSAVSFFVRFDRIEFLLETAGWSFTCCRPGFRGEHDVIFVAQEAVEMGQIYVCKFEPIR